MTAARLVAMRGALHGGRGLRGVAPALWRGVHCIPRLASGRSVVLSAVQCRSCASSAGDGSPAPASPKIEALVEQISALTLLEAAELTDALKERLGISSAMMMPAAGGGGPAAGAAAPAEEEEAAPAKTVFTVRLEKFEASSKIKLIKEVRAIAGLGLKESKELVENLPKDVKVDVKEEEANELKVPYPPPCRSIRFGACASRRPAPCAQEKLEAAGGTVVID